MTHDKDKVYFRVETADALTPASDPNWMMLFIDVDRDRNTGWNGYDYIVNRVSPKSGKVTIEKCVDNTWNWTHAARSLCRQDNVLELEIAKSLLGLGDDIAIEFKWNDNMQRPAMCSTSMSAAIPLPAAVSTTYMSRSRNEL